jgi:hypothetical protein
LIWRFLDGFQLSQPHKFFILALKDIETKTDLIFCFWKQTETLFWLVCGQCLCDAEVQIWGAMLFLGVSLANEQGSLY